MTKLRVGMIVNGQFRRLLSIVENKRGEITIGISSAERLHLQGTGAAILHQKYTVHQSQNSERYNSITHTLVSVGQKQRSYSLTDAIKLKRGFAFLFARRCPNLANDRYLLKNAKHFQPVILNESVPQKGTPVQAIFVGHADTEFVRPAGCPFEVQEIIFDQVRLVIVFSELILPAHNSGDFIHSITYDPKTAPPELEESFWQMLEGMSLEQCLAYARSIFSRLFVRQCAAVIKSGAIDDATICSLKEMVAAMGLTIPETLEDGISLSAIPVGPGHPPSPNPESDAQPSPPPPD